MTNQSNRYSCLYLVALSSLFYATFIIRSITNTSSIGGIRRIRFDICIEEWINPHI